MRAIVLILCVFIGGCAAARPDPPAPTLKLDHLWIATGTGAEAERAALEQAGFRIAPTINRHDGQGTASATVEFENGYLELIYPDDSVPVTGPGGAIGKARFAERAAWRGKHVSPFGIAVSRTPNTPSPLPFETWRVTSDWMEPGTYMEMLTPRGSRATNIAVHAHATDEIANRTAIAQGGERAWPFLHSNGARRLTRVEMIAPDSGGLPPSAPFLNQSGAAVQLRVGEEWLAIVTLDEGGQRETRDLRPTLPLIIRF